MKKMIQKLISLSLVSAMAFAAFAGCAPSESPAAAPAQTETAAAETSASEEAPYKFALIAPLTGNNSQYGLAYKRAVELLVEQTNNAGGINGAEVQIEIYDDKNDATEAVTIANSVVEQADILGCVGSQTSTPSMAMAPLFQEAGIPLVSPNASHTDFAAIGDYIFRTTYMTNVSSKAIGEQAFDLVNEARGEVKAGIIYMQTDWGLAFNQYFTEALEGKGGQVLVAEPYIVEQTSDFTPLLTKIQNAGCNVVVLGTNYNEGGQIVKQAKKLGMDVEFVTSTMLFKKEFIDLVGADGEGIFVTTMFNKNNQSQVFQDMKKAYIEKYGSDDDIDEYVVKAYDALLLLIDGAKEAGHDRQGIRDYIANVKDWEGATNTITMDEEGNPVGPVFATVIKDGQFEYLN